MTKKPKPATLELTLTFHDPNVTPPPFEKLILAGIGSVNYGPRGKKESIDLHAVKVMVCDYDGDEDEGSAMKDELERGDAKWDDLQFGIEKLGEEGEITNDFASDSIEWWADLPTLPLT